MKTSQKYMIVHVPVLQFPHFTSGFSHYLALDERQVPAETRLTAEV